MSARVLNLFQITSVRTAWAFLVLATLMFFLGVYYAVELLSSPAPSSVKSADIWFLCAWFLATGCYIALASWALFTDAGRAYLVSQQPSTPARNLRQYIRLAPFAAAGLACIGIALMLISNWFPEYTCRCEVPGHWECKSASCTKEMNAHLREYGHAIRCRRTDWAATVLTSVLSPFLPQLRDDTRK